MVGRDAFSATSDTVRKKMLGHLKSLQKVSKSRSVWIYDAIIRLKEQID